MKEKNFILGFEIVLPGGCPAKVDSFEPQFDGKGKNKVTLIKCRSYKPERKSCSKCKIGQANLICTLKFGDPPVENP